MNEVFEKVSGIIARQFKVATEAIKPETELVKDLSADSASVMVLIMDLEDQFNMQVEDEAIVNLKSVGDVVEYIKSRLG